MTDCVFCKKIEEGSVKDEGTGVCSFEPLNPVTKGHLLVVPMNHKPDFTHSQAEASNVMFVASRIAKTMGDVNLITSKGKNATQTIKHLHIHLIPRRKDDGLKLPWS